MSGFRNQVTLASLLLCVIAASVPAQGTFVRAADNHIYAQSLVDGLMAGHPELIIVGFHAVAPGATDQTKIATNEDKVGRKDDPDDLMASQDRKTILAPNLHGLGRYEVLLPLKDARDSIIGALGLVFKYKEGDSEVGLLTRGLAIRDDLKRRIPRLASLFAPPATATAAITGGGPEVGQAGQPAQSDAREAPPMRLVQEIPLPGVQGRLDHFTIDAKRKRVIFSGLGNNTVQVVDAFAGRMIANIPGLSQPQGTLYVPEGDKLFVANAADGHVNVYNGTTFKPITSIDFGADPDNLRYDAASKRIYVGYGDGAIGVIDATTNKRLPIDYKFEGHPEGFQLESKGPRIFVNVADTKSIQVIDRTTGKVTSWALPKGHSANFPMVLDEANRRVLIGTRKPSRLTVLDMDTGNVVASHPSTGDMDDLFYDADRKRVYVAGGEGFLSVFQQKDPDHYVDMGKFATAVGTRTGVWYVKRDRLYVAAPPSGSLGARLLVFEAQDY